MPQKCGISRWLSLKRIDGILWHQPSAGELLGLKSAIFDEFAHATIGDTKGLRSLGDGIKLGEVDSHNHGSYSTALRNSCNLKNPHG